MKKMKKYVLVLVLALSPLFLFAQIRSYVGIVRGEMSQENKEFLENYKDELKKVGYTSLSKEVESFLKGGFGSGFVFVDTDGKNYIITNSHVVMEAETASVEFDDSEKEHIYENLKIVAIDEDIDIALLAFPDNVGPFKKGLELETDNLQDADEVWSAGFPGLGNNPVWQLGKGNVTNASVAMKELLDPNISKIIQHSAPVDPGNSGGPLLKASATATGGYKVVGVNTWKANFRQSANLSLPAKVVKDFIQSSLHKKTNEFSEADCKTRTEKMLSYGTEKDTNFTKIINFISYTLAKDLGPELLLKIVETGSAQDRSTVLNYFAFSPLEGLRCAVAHELWNKLDLAEATFVIESVNLTENTDQCTIVLKNEENTLFPLSFIFEQGNLRFVKIDDKENSAIAEKKSSKEETAKSGSVKFYINNVRDIYLYGNFALPVFASDDTIGFNFSLDIFRGSFFPEFLSLTAAYTNYPNYNTKYSLLSFGSRLQLPCDFSAFFVNPFLGADLGMSINFSDFGISDDHDIFDIPMFTFDAVAVAGVKIGKDFASVCLFLNLEYKHFLTNNYKALYIGLGIGLE